MVFICVALCDLVPFELFIKHENTHGGELRLTTKSSPPRGYFLRFSNFTNGTKSRKASHMVLFLKLLSTFKFCHMCHGRMF